MKIIIVGEEGSGDNKKALPPFYIKPDSALMKSGKPFFVPYDACECVCTFHLVARISRLGKSIPERFAKRYYDGVTLGVNFWAEDRLQQLKAQGQPWEAATAMDGSAVIGGTVATERILADSSPRLCLNGKEIETSVLKDASLLIDNEIARLSTFFQIRQGDLLFSGPLTRPVKVVENDHVEAWLDKDKLLELNVK